MKTIFITVFQGMEFRNIIRTDIYGELVKQPDLRLVLFTDSLSKKEYYEKEFSAPNVIYEVVESHETKRLNAVFRFLKFNLIRTSTIDIKRKQQLARDKNYPKYVLKLIFNRIFARKFFRKMVRRFDFWLVGDSFFSPYFSKYKPGLVLLAHLFGETEVAMLREAKKRKVKSVGLINSWDKLTARCMLRLLPEEMIVHNELIKKDTVRYTDMPPRRIIVTGVPHFDYYIEKRANKAEFYGRLGIDVGCRIILYTPVGRTNSALDLKTISLLDDLLVSGRLPKNLRLIVRFPPNDEVELPSGFKSDIIFQRPGKRFSLKRGTDWDMSQEDFEELADTLYHSSVLVGYSSTMAIDAAAFDKPIINLDFSFPSLPSNHWIYEVAHYKPVLESGAVRLVRNVGELAEWINRYLGDPSLDQEARKRLVGEQCWRLDGQAGKRVVEFVMRQLQ